MTEKEKENRIHSFALSFLERQQIVPNLYADQIIRGYKEGYHQAEKDLKVKEVEEPSNDLEEAASQYSFNIPSAIFNDLTPVLQNIWKREIEGAFIAGAQWQKKQDQLTIELAEDHAYLAGQEKIIAKACDWLEDNIDRYLYNTGGYGEYIPKCGGKMYEDFKKAMEE